MEVIKKPRYCARAVQQLTTQRILTSCGIPFIERGVYLGTWRVDHKSAHDGERCSICSEFLQVKEEQESFQLRESWK